VKYFVGQGKVYLSPKDSSGNPTGFVFLGNTPSLEFNVGRAGDRYATGGGTPYGLVKGGGNPVVSLILDEITQDNLAKAFYGAVTTVAGATVANETVVAALEKMVPLANINITSWTSLRHSSGTPVYVRDVDYSVNLKAGSLTFPSSGTAITNGQSLRANYVYGSYNKIPAFTTVPAFYWLRFEGVNVADDDSPCILDCYKVKLMPAQGLSLIGETFSSVQFLAPMYYDSTRGGTDGYFFRIRQT
jgi:hypothetical protein